MQVLSGAMPVSTCLEGKQLKTTQSLSPDIAVVSPGIMPHTLASLQGLTTSFWDAERDIHCEGSQCFEPACSKGCAGRAIHGGQAVLCDGGDR